MPDKKILIKLAMTGETGRDLSDGVAQYLLSCKAPKKDETASKKVSHIAYYFGRHGKLRLENLILFLLDPPV